MTEDEISNDGGEVWHEIVDSTDELVYLGGGHKILVHELDDSKQKL